MDFRAPLFEQVYESVKDLKIITNYGEDYSFMNNGGVMVLPFNQARDHQQIDRLTDMGVSQVPDLHS